MEEGTAWKSSSKPVGRAEAGLPPSCVGVERRDDGGPAPKNSKEIGA